MRQRRPNPAGAETRKGPRPTCYVCGNVIRSGAVAVGPDLRRHQRCVPGSVKYMKNAELAQGYRELCGAFRQAHEVGASVFANALATATNTETNRQG